jgi:hypothetical protein
MTKYTINPCTDKVWLILFKRISKVAKETNMYIKEIDIFEAAVIPNILVKRNPFKQHKAKEENIRRTWVPCFATTIILEKLPDEKDYQKTRTKT